MILCVFFFFFFFFFFVWYCLDTMNLTGFWPSLSLETPDIRRNIDVLKKMQNHMKTEEIITLEPTPPLKRIYTPPSIKVLFPLNQCKYFFRKNVHNNPPPPLFKKTSSWTPPPSDNPILTNFFTHTEQDLISVTIPRRKTYSSLTFKRNQH